MIIWNALGKGLTKFRLSRFELTHEVIAVSGGFELLDNLLLIGALSFDARADELV
jgi:hypothetical protein